MLNWHSISTNQKLVEVPIQVFVSIASHIKPLWKALLQEGKQLTCLWPIYIHLAEHWERDSVLVLDKLLDVIIGSRLLLTKLVAWER